MIKFSVLKLGEGAISQCTRCGPTAPRVYRPTTDVLADMSRIVDTWPTGPGPNVTLCGPEPLEHPEIETLLRALHDSDIQRACVHTGGGPLVSPSACEHILASGVNHIRTVLLAGDAATHDALNDTPGSWDTAMHGIALMSQTASQSAAPLMLCGLIPVCSHNLDQLPQTIIALAGAGVRSIALDVTTLASDPRSASWITAAVDTGMVSGVWVSPVGDDAASYVPQPEWALCPVELCEATL